MTEKVKRYPVIELFGPTIQGEGYLLGRPTHFLRFGGCGYNCSWCDSMHAVDPAQIKANRTMMSVDDIMDGIQNLPRTPWLTLTGGDPCLHAGLENLILPVRTLDMNVCVETQGELFPSWLEEVDVVTFSPKGPSSGNVTDIMQFRQKLTTFYTNTIARIVIKVVVFDEHDLAYAIRLHRALMATNGAKLYSNFYYQVGSPIKSQIPDGLAYTDGLTEEEQVEAQKFLQSQYVRNTILARYEWLVAALLKHGELMDENTGITPQTHTLLWPLEEKGR